MSSAVATRSPAVLRVEDLAVSFDGVRAVDGVWLTLRSASVHAVVGESGSGKSVTAMSVLGLNPSPPATAERGRVLLGETNLLRASPRAMRRVRGGRVAMIFQEPMTSLNPVFSVGEQLVETIRRHHAVSVARARAIAVAALDEVGIPEAGRRLGAFPHEFSGGMRQRVMIAMALACEPEVLLADEPTTALDVTVQRQILELLERLTSSRGLGIVLITHDLGVVARHSDAVTVMYAGRVVEHARTDELLRRPLHPYTRALLACSPSLRVRRDRLTTVGQVLGDAPEAIGPGLAWWPAHAPPDGSGDECVLREVEPGRWVALWGTPKARALPWTVPDAGAR